MAQLLSGSSYQRGARTPDIRKVKGSCGCRNASAADGLFDPRSDRIACNAEVSGIPGSSGRSLSTQCCVQVVPLAGKSVLLGTVFLPSRCGPSVLQAPAGECS